MHWFILSIDSKKLLYGYSVEVDKDAFYTEDTSHIYLIEDKEDRHKMELMMKNFMNNMRN